MCKVDTFVSLWRHRGLLFCLWSHHHTPHLLRKYALSIDFYIGIRIYAYLCWQASVSNAAPFLRSVGPMGHQDASPHLPTVGRIDLWLRLAVGCLFLMAGLGLGSQGFGPVSSRPSLVPVGPRGNWYDLCLHHLQLPPHNHLTKDNSAHHQRLPPLAWCLAFHCLLCVVFLPPAH